MFITPTGRAKYIPINVNWFFSYIEIPNLEQIKKELIELRFSDNSVKQKFNNYLNFYQPEIVKPKSLIKYLDELNLSHKFSRIFFSLPETKNMNTIGPHVDSVIPTNTRRYSLNIPLIDAEDSYTAWFKIKSGSTISFNYPNLTGWVNDKNDVEEIYCARYIKPMLLNTSILHGPKSEKSTRLIAGLRFQPELTFEEIERLGVPIPLTQVD